MKHAWLIGLSAAVGFALCGVNLGRADDKDSKSTTTTAKKPVVDAEKAATVKPADNAADKKIHRPLFDRFERQRLTPEQRKQVQEIRTKYQPQLAELQQQIAKLQRELGKLEAERNAETLAVFKAARTKSSEKTAANKPVEKVSAPEKK
jgi:Spy/CpxP family protein refolding chaperone